MPRFFANVGGENGGAVVVEGDQSTVKRCIPEGGEQEAVVDIEALGIAEAFAPGDDVGGTQKWRVSDTGEWAAALPVVHEAGAENFLPNALDHEALGFGGLW